MSDILIINGIAVASPVSASWDDGSISSAETGRDSAGNMQNDIITTKKSLPYTWGWLTPQETSELLTAIKKNGLGDIDVTIHDPEINAPKTYNFMLVIDMYLQE
jgi:hypothetical protein